MKYARLIAGYIIREFRTITTSYSILLVLVGGVFIYGLLYNYMYQPNLIRHVPIVIVDQSNTILSREYLRLLEASPQIKIYAYASDLTAAKKLMKTQKTVGIVYIPHDFETRTGRGEQAIFMAMGNTSAFLNFAAIQEATAGAMIELDGRHRAERAVYLSLPTLYAISQTQPINIVGTPLYNYIAGYGSYLIPAVFILILFQTLMMIIGMITGNERHTLLILDYADNGIGPRNIIAIVLSKTFTYCILYAIFAYFLIGLLPKLFSIPDIGNTFDIIALLILFLLSSSFFGLTCSIMYTDSESPILMIAFFSVGLVFLSGMSYPLELMPWYWQAIHYIIPAPPAVLAYIQVNSMGATLADIRTEYLTLTLQTISYFFTACLAIRHNITRSLKDKINKQIEIDKDRG